MFLKLKLYIAAIGAALLGLAAIYFRGRSAGADAAERKHLEGRIDAIKDAQEVQNEIDALDDTELSSRARSWVREDER